MADPPKLDDLIRNAERVADKHVRHSNVPSESSAPIRLALCFIALVVVGFALFKLVEALAPPSQKEIARDLEAAVERAHQLVDGIKQETGELPATLPNASLANVVGYELRDKKYRLSSSIGGVQVTFEWDGKTRTEIKE